jgi:hypothetical protein
VKTSDFPGDNDIRNRFSEDDMDEVNSWFACDSERPTVEDRYVRLFTGRDRWAERQRERKHAGKKAGKHN